MLLEKVAPIDLLHVGLPQAAILWKTQYLQITAGSTMKRGVPALFGSLEGMTPESTALCVM